MTALIQGFAPGDLIAYSWFVMGFRPRESLVVVGLCDGADLLDDVHDHWGDADADADGDPDDLDDLDDDLDDDEGPDGFGGLRDDDVLGPGVVTSGAVARVDLPTSRTARAAADAVADLLDTSGDDVCVLLVVSDAAGDGPLVDARGRMPHDATLERVVRRLAVRGIDVLDVMLVGTRTYRSYVCLPSCCDPMGRSLEDVASSPVAAEMVVRGRTVADTEDELVADVAPALAAARGERLLAAPAGRPGRAATRAALRRWCADLDAAADSPTRAQALLEAMTDRGLRDAVLMSLVPRSRQAAFDLLDGVVDLGSRPLDVPPDPRLADAGRRLLSALARRTPQGHRAEALAVLAWLAWWTGDAVRSRLLVAQVLAEQPGHRLARLVEAMLAASVPPPWTTAARHGLHPPGASLFAAPARRRTGTANG